MSLRRRETRLRFAVLLRLGALLHVVVEIGIHVRGLVLGRFFLVRTIPGKVPLLLTDSARVIRRLRTVAREVPGFAASTALIRRLGPASFALRSVIRLRTLRRPVTLFTASVTHVLRAGLFLFPSFIVSSSRSVGAVPSRGAASGFATVARKVSEPSTNSARSIASRATDASVRGERARTISLVVSKTSASRAPIRGSRPAPEPSAASRVGQRALARPVSNLSTPVTPVRSATRLALRAVSRVVSELPAVSARPSRGRTARVRGVPSPGCGLRAVVIHPFPHDCDSLFLRFFFLRRFSNSGRDRRRASSSLGVRSNGRRSNGRARRRRVPTRSTRSIDLRIHSIPFAPTLP